MLAGSHYNRGWTVHNAMSEALERLLMSRFLNVVPESLVNLSADPNPSTVQQVHEDLLEFFEQFETFRSYVRSGKAGKTAQYWLWYLDLMKAQIAAHTAVQENKMDLLIYAWKMYIPMYFSLNKVNLCSLWLVLRPHSRQHG